MSDMNPNASDLAHCLEDHVNLTNNHLSDAHNLEFEQDPNNIIDVSARDNSGQPMIMNYNTNDVSSTYLHGSQQSMVQQPIQHNNFVVGPQSQTS